MWEEALKENLKQKQDAINLNSNLQDGWLGLDEFIELINNIDRIRHANVVELVGYCSEHDQKASNL